MLLEEDCLSKYELDFPIALCIHSPEAPGTSDDPSYNRQRCRSIAEVRVGHAAIFQATGSETAEEMWRWADVRTVCLLQSGVCVRSNSKPLLSCEDEEQGEVSKQMRYHTLSAASVLHDPTVGPSVSWQALPLAGKRIDTGAMVEVAVRFSIVTSF